MLFDFLLFVVGISVGTYLIYLLTLFTIQRKLVFQSVKSNYLLYSQIEAHSLQFSTSDNVELHGWKVSGLLNKPVQERVLIFFGGNAQDVATVIPSLKLLNVHHIYAFNYRGVGQNKGKTSEFNLYQDALTLHDYVKSAHEQSRIIVMGHSLGSAVAGYVGSHRKPSNVLLLCPLHSLTKIALEKFYVPTFLVKYHFPLFQFVKEFCGETLLLIAENDEIIPRRHSLYTQQNLKVKHTFQEIKGANHNSIFNSSQTFEQINKFLDKS